MTVVGVFEKNVGASRCLPFRLLDVNANWYYFSREDTHAFAARRKTQGGHKTRGSEKPAHGK
jgi:hypothetical protein